MIKKIHSWLTIIVIMFFIMVFLGGITRLKDAGLSIVEWKPVTGIIPPLNEQQWQEEFEKYKQIGQYELLHSHFTLEDFKRIYWLEWFHRLWGRLMGFVILLPALWWWARGKFPTLWLKRVLILVFLMLIQATLGWLMVKTGVDNPLPWVDPLFLGIHNLFALFVFSYVVYLWFISRPSGWSPLPSSWSKPLHIALALFALQFFYGTLMAGMRAALAGTSYPTFYGDWIPQGLWLPELGWENLLENKVLINFIHRHLALFLVLPFFFIKPLTHRVNLFLIGLWTLQFLLGIHALVFYTKDIKIYFAVLHQLNGWLFFMVLFIAFLRTKEKFVKKWTEEKV